MSKMKTSSTRPTSGQFTATWEFDGKVWSDTFKYDETDNALLVYSEDIDDWKKVGPEEDEGGVAPWIDRNHPAIFIVLA